MILVRSILKGLADDRALDGHVATASPVRDLVEQYNKIAIHDDNLPKITALSTGLQLKDSIGLLEPEDQVALLHKYTVAIKSPEKPDEYKEDASKADVRKMRMFVFKACVVLLAIFVCVMLGVTATVAVKSGTMPNDGGVLKTIVMTTGDILKTMFTSSSK